MENKCINEYLINKDLNIEQITKEYTQYLYKVIENMGNLRKEDIEEVLSETFFSIWLNRDTIMIDKPLLPYLTGIAKNITRKKFRKLKYENNIDDYENTLIYEDITISTIEAKTKNEILNTEIEKLSENDKRIFELFYYSNKKTKEISKILNTKDFYVRNRLRNIRKKLRKRLEEIGYGK